jgi:hypothetical protein
LVKEGADRRRIFVVGTNGESLFHLMSVVEATDGSFYCNLGEKIDPKDTHWSYHASGEFHFYIGKELIESGTIEAPAQLERVLNFPSAIAHMNLLSGRSAFDASKKLQSFNPSTVIYIDLSSHLDKSINIHSFIFPPSLIDHIKASFLFENNVLQVQLETSRIPWIGFIVLATKHSASGPVAGDFRKKSNLDYINLLFERKFSRKNPSP